MLMETRDLDMELLRTFVAAAERESFAVAAARGFCPAGRRSPPMPRAGPGGGGGAGSRVSRAGCRPAADAAARSGGGLRAVHARRAQQAPERPGRAAAGVREAHPEPERRG